MVLLSLLMSQLLLLPVLTTLLPRDKLLQLLPQLPQLPLQLPPMVMLVPSTLTPSLLLTQMELLSQLMSPLLLLPVLTTLPPREFMEESMPMPDQQFTPLDMLVFSPSPMELLSQLMSQPLPLPVLITLLPLLLLTKREPISHYDCL